MNYTMIPLESEDIPEFKRLMQDAFQKGFEDEFGSYDKKILPDTDIDESLYADGAAAYKVVDNGEIIGGTVVNVNAETGHSHLDILFVKTGVQSKGVGMYIWNELERLYSHTKIWETFTPYYEKRNIHFYVNKCGFKIVEFFNPQHLAEWNEDGKETGNIPNEIGQYFLRFEKVAE